MKVLQIAGPYLPVPPGSYGGSERVIDSLARELPGLGVDLTTFTVGSSRTPGRVEFFFRRQQAEVDGAGVISTWDPVDVSIQAGKAFALAHDYDFVHNHMSHGVVFSEICRTPMLTTLHSYAATGSASDRIFASFPRTNYVAISDNQRRLATHLNVVATVPNPIPAEIWSERPHVEKPGDYLLFLGRLSHLKGVEIAIRLASGLQIPLVVAGTVFAADRPYFRDVVEPHLSAAGVDYVGSVAGRSKTSLISGALATVVPSQWDEPFGLTAIESMALGTPAVVSRRGALPELVEDGVTGVVVDDFNRSDAILDRIMRLDRSVVAERTRPRFAPATIAAAYLDLYRRLRGVEAPSPPPLASR